jgi:hypothetical protein
MLGHLREDSLHQLGNQKCYTGENGLIFIEVLLTKKHRRQIRVLHLGYIDVCLNF